MEVENKKPAAFFAGDWNTSKESLKLSSVPANLLPSVLPPLFHKSHTFVFVPLPLRLYRESTQVSLRPGVSIINIPAFKSVHLSGLKFQFFFMVILEYSGLLISNYYSLSTILELAFSFQSLEQEIF